MNPFNFPHMSKHAGTSPHGEEQGVGHRAPSVIQGLNLEEQTENDRMGKDLSDPLSLGGPSGRKRRHCSGSSEPAESRRWGSSPGRSSHVSDASRDEDCVSSGQPALTFIAPPSVPEKSQRLLALQGDETQKMAQRYLPGQYFQKKVLCEFRDRHGILDEPMTIPPVLDEEIKTVAGEFGASINWKADASLVDIQRHLLDIWNPLLALHDVAERSHRANSSLSPLTVMNYVQYAMAYTSSTVQRLNFQRRKNVIRAVELAVSSRFKGNSPSAMVSKPIMESLEREPVSDNSLTVLQSGRSAPLLFGDQFVQTLSSQSEKIGTVRKGMANWVSNSFGPGVAAQVKKSAASSSDHRGQNFKSFKTYRQNRQGQPFGSSTSSDFARPRGRSAPRYPHNQPRPWKDHNFRNQERIQFPQKQQDSRREFSNKLVVFNPELSSSAPSAVGGRLCHFALNWEQITNDQWVLETIKGYEIPFIKPPFQSMPPRQLKFSADDGRAVDTEVQEMLHKHAIRIVPNANQTEGFYSQLFLRAKKDGGNRPILNVHPLNQFIPYEHFKMEGLHLLSGVICSSDYLAKLDLKDAYFTVPLAETSKKYLRFIWNEVVYEFQCLCFGLSSAPRVFTKILKPVISLLRRNGIRLLIYLDDFLIVNSSQDGLISDIRTVTHILESLGFIINVKKSILEPTHSLEFLGLTLDSVNLTLSVPRDKIALISKKAKILSATNSVSVRDLAKFLGLTNSICRALLPGKLFCRALQFDMNENLNTTGSYDSYCTLSPKSKTELHIWRKAMWSWNGRNLLPPEPDFTFSCDASQQGWGAVHKGNRVSGLWSLTETKEHINFLELKAIFLGLKAFFSSQENCHILIHSDNRTAISYLNKLGGTHSEKLCSLAVELWCWCLEKGITIEATHIAGVNNSEADFESRRGFETCDWKLLPSVFQTLESFFGSFDIDLFAARHNAQIPRFCSWLLDPEAETIDAFSRNWSDLYGYAFPPFILINRVLSKVTQDKATIVLIAPLWPAQTWYARLLSLLCHNPVLLPALPDLLTNPVGDHHPLAVQGRLPLAAWLISGDISRTLDYQQQLPLSSSTSLHQIPKDSTNLPLRSGLVGVLNRRLILFTHLKYNL